ncbi:MAG TPA: hypothetical protein VFG10_16185 [Saprospiraceae bacterium]|nr:hypothetical protein [Saprospiraceae bacterium]
MHLRYLILLYINFLFIGHSVFAQNNVVVSILIPPPYSPYLNDYLQYENRMVIQLQNTTSQSVSIKLLGSIEGDNGISLVTNADYLPPTPITIAPGGTFRIPASTRSRSFFDPDHLDFNGPPELKTQILKDGILPEGNYMICLRAFDYQNDTPLSEESPSGCALLPISYPTPAELVAPECESEFDQSLPFFQWTLPGGNTGASAITYDLFIVEWLKGSNPQDLIQLAVDYNAGNAIIRRNLSSPAYQYSMIDPGLKDGVTYLWVVQAKDRFNHVTFENNGLSEVCSFTYRRNFDPDNGINVGIIPPHDYEIVQNRTRIEGQLKYKFPDAAIPQSNLMNFNFNFETEPLEYEIYGENENGLSIFDEGITALANHNYKDAFPVSPVNSKPLKNISVKLVESWVITDCQVTYLPQGTVEHKDFFIIPNEDVIGILGGSTLAVVVDGISEINGGNPIAFENPDRDNEDLYNHVLAVDHTDANGNYSFNFTQSTPGLSFNQYGGHASILFACSDTDVPAEENEFVHPLDIVSNPADIVSNPSDNLSNPGDIYSGINTPGNPGLGLNNAGEINMPGNTTLRSGELETPSNQQGYTEISIDGGHLYKVLRLEVASPYYYSPDLIFWTQPGDTFHLPDQVSYVKAVDVDLDVIGGRWENHQNYQIYDEGLEVPNIDVVYSRKKDGLPREIPMEEGQGLRDYAGASDGEYQYEIIEEDGYENEALYDSVSVLDSGEDMMYTRLVAGYPYYVKGTTPDGGNLNYKVPLQIKQYEIFSPQSCLMNLSVNLNSFSNHKSIFIQDAVIAHPQRPKVFGRIVTTTGDDKETLRNVMIDLKRYEGDVVKENHRLFSDEYGRFEYDDLNVDAEGHQSFHWKIFFEYLGYANQMQPANGVHTLKPGEQWDLGDIVMDPLGTLTGYIKDEDGRMVHALVKLVTGPHIQTEIVPYPNGEPEFCGIVNEFGDAIDESTRVYDAIQMGIYEPMYAQMMEAAKFILPAASGNHRRLVVIPLPEQYFQDTCFVDVDDIPSGQFQDLGFITVKEKLHRIGISVKGPDGGSAQATVRIDENVRETNDLGFTSFRFASPEINYRVRIDPDSPTLVPVDTIMQIPISKTYLSQTFRLKEGKKIRVRVLLNQSGQQQQSQNPIPIQGATVQTLLSTSPSGNHYIQCTTNSEGICTLEGVPATPSMVDITAWKDDDDNLYIGNTSSASTNRPLNPPFDISLKRLSGVVVPDIWGFPTAITDLEIKTVNGHQDTLLEGIITELPENTRFKSKDDEVQLPYHKMKFTYSGRRNDEGKKIMEPVVTSFTLYQHSVECLLFNKFEAALTPKRFVNYQTLPNLTLYKVGNGNGKLEGVVETGLSSFNWSYNYDGKFFLGKTPTEYNLDVFQTGMQLYASLGLMTATLVGQEPSPGVDDFYLMDIGPQNRPRSQSYQVFQFAATSDSSRSFVSQEAFYIHTILHTDIPHVIPRDLKLSVGKIVVSNETIESFNNGINKLDFQMGKLWRYYSTTPFRYDADLGAITATNGFIQTGQIDVPVRNPIIKPTQLIMNEIDNISQLTLAGIKDVPVLPNVNIILSNQDPEPGWMLTVQKLDGDGHPMPDAPVAEIKNLTAPLQNSDVISVSSILMTSEIDDVGFTVTGSVRPFNIVDFQVEGITSGQGYFVLSGSAELGRAGVRVPGMRKSSMAIQYNGPKNNLTGKIVSSFTDFFETSGQVNFTMDPNTLNTTQQFYTHKRFVSTGVIKVSEGGHNFLLKGILDVDYDHVKISVIDADLNIPNIDYVKQDQEIRMGVEKRLLVRKGVQLVNLNEWASLTFDANLDQFTGLKPSQPPMPFVVHGPVETAGASLKVDNIDVGFGEIELEFDFEKQSLFGSLNFDPPGDIYFGPVSVDQIEAQILVEPQGFLFASVIEGHLTAVFPVTLGLLLGSHTDVPDKMISFVMEHAKNRNPPSSLTDHKLTGFFLTGRIDLVDEQMPSVNLVFFTVSGGVSVGFDARVSMDFDPGAETFSFAALAWAGAMIEASVLVPPLTPPFPCELSICLAAEVQLLIEGELAHQGNEWVVTGHGCGSLTFSASTCNITETISGKADIYFSSANGTDVSATLGESCAGGSNNEFTCE